MYQAGRLQKKPPLILKKGWKSASNARRRPAEEQLPRRLPRDGERADGRRILGHLREPPWRGHELRDQREPGGERAGHRLDDRLWRQPHELSGAGLHVQARDVHGLRR